MDYCLVYRTGNRNSFAWHRSAKVSKTDATRVLHAWRSRGGAAYVELYQRSRAIGLPETYAQGERL